MFNTYELDNRMRLIPGPETATVNFNELKAILMSKDLSRNEELSWTKASLRFLDASVDMVGNRVCFASYARTGNTMIRKYLEAITGVYTGCDMPLEATLQIQVMGMVGEEHVSDDNTVWITKSHWPEPVTPSFLPEREFTMDKAFVITRNPIDVFASRFLLFNLCSHSLTCEEKINEAFPAEWDAYIRGQVTIFKQYHAFLIEQLANNVPVYFCRYED
jgi:hypothetical protein